MALDGLFFLPFACLSYKAEAGGKLNRLGACYCSYFQERAGLPGAFYEQKNVRHGEHDGL